MAVCLSLHADNDATARSTRRSPFKAEREFEENPRAIFLNAYEHNSGRNTNTATCPVTLACFLTALDMCCLSVGVVSIQLAINQGCVRIV